MFDILVYLYETYYRPDACSDAVALTKKLTAEGFDDEEIVVALDWLRGLADSSNRLASGDSDDVRQSSLLNASHGFRVYTEDECRILGPAALGYLHYLQNIAVLDAQSREILIERAMAVEDAPLSLSKFKIVVLMILWSQGQQSELLMFDELLFADDAANPRFYH